MHSPLKSSVPVKEVIYASVESRARNHSSTESHSDRHRRWPQALFCGLVFACGGSRDLGKCVSTLAPRSRGVVLARWRVVICRLTMTPVRRCWGKLYGESNTNRAGRTYLHHMTSLCFWLIFAGQGRVRRLSPRVLGETQAPIIGTTKSTQ